MQLHELTIHEALEVLRRRELSSSELTQAVLDRILAVDNDIKAYIKSKLKEWGIERG